MTTSKALKLLAILAMWLAFGPTAAMAQQDWTVTLTAQQAKGVEQARAGRRNTAVAISPDGIWGWSQGMASAGAAETRALQFCRGFLRKGQRDCMIYAVNGKRVLPATVKTRRVSAVYKPLHPRRAGAFFGLSPLSFKGNPTAAKAALKGAQANPGRLAADTRLMAGLRGRTLMNSGGRPFAIWFGDKGAEQHSSANSGVLTITYQNWVATRDGLVCLIGGRWQSTGKAARDNCLFLTNAANGRLDMFWGIQPNTRRKAVLVAGDAGYGAAK